MMIVPQTYGKLLRVCTELYSAFYVKFIDLNFVDHDPSLQEMALVQEMYHWYTKKIDAYVSLDPQRRRDNARVAI